MRIATVLIVLTGFMLLATQAQAGAWPRPRGEGFASSTIRLSWPQDMSTWVSRKPTGEYYTLYLEYGMTDRLTVGLDLGRSISGAGKTVGFLRLPLRDRDHGLKIATELGLGRIDGEPVVRPGLSLGLGMESGWLSADGLAEVSMQTGFTDFKLDLTWGLNLRKDRKLILQMQTGKQYGDEPFARFAPSIVVPLIGRLKGEFGGAWGVRGDTSMGVTMGVWLDF